jgi:hypothetical protein
MKANKEYRITKKVFGISVLCTGIHIYTFVNKLDLGCVYAINMWMAGSF